MQFKKYTCNSFPSYASVDTSGVDKAWRYKAWDDPVGKSLSRNIGYHAENLQKKEKELIDYLEDLEREGALDNDAVKYRRMTDAIRSNIAEVV